MRTGIWSPSLLVKQLFLKRSRLGNRDRTNRDRGEKTKSEKVRTRQTKKKQEWLFSRAPFLFQIRLLYSNAGGEWFQAADNGPTGSILTFSLVIAELAG